jgi:integrase
MSYAMIRHTVKKRAPVLSKQQFHHALKVASITRDPERNQLILCMSHALGMRVTELARVTVDDFIYPSGRIRHEISLRSSITKNSTGRVVPLANDLLIEHLERYLAYRVDNRIGVPAASDDYRGLAPSLPLIFSGRGSGFGLSIKRRRLESGVDEEYLAADGLESLFRHLYKISGIKGGSSHSGRRTYATRLAEAGVDIEDIARLLGHDNVNYTLVYLDVSPKAIRQAFEMAV